jgi:hypothetical protein
VVNVGPFGKRQSHWLFEPLLFTEPLFPWFFGPATNSDRSERADSRICCNRVTKQLKAIQQQQTLVFRAGGCDALGHILRGG